ncbi:hypothetical protein M3Y99_01176400 [Aphelenchoides fujianensis]|nr:hypothetical protein M3Y99_01176400 [Aphelenchoides fujianensis]
MDPNVLGHYAIDPPPMPNATQPSAYLEQEPNPDYSLLQEAPADCSPLAARCDCHSTYQFYEFDENVLLGCFCFVIIAFGLIANLVSVRIFTHKLMSSHCINWYLAVLTTSDSVVLFASFFVLTFPRFGEMTGLWWATSFSYSISSYCYGLMTLAQTVSVWMTIGMSLHRFVGVCFPYRAIEWLNERNVRRIIGGILAFSIGFNATRFLEVHVVGNCYRTNIDAYIPVIAPTELRLNATYRLIFFGWLYTLLMFIVPFSILIVVNTAVLVALRRSNRLHSHFPTPQMPTRLDQHAYGSQTSPSVVSSTRTSRTNTNSSAKSSKSTSKTAVTLTPNGCAATASVLPAEKCAEVGGGGVDPLAAMEAVERHLAAKRQEAKERQTTAVLVALVVVFLCCNLLAFLANIMENLGYDQNAYYGVMITYSNFLVIINASSNVFIYMLFSEKYRLLLNAYVFRALKQRGENELLLSNAPVSL